MQGAAKCDPLLQSTCHDPNQKFLSSSMIWKCELTHSISPSAEFGRKQTFPVMITIMFLLHKIRIPCDVEVKYRALAIAALTLHRVVLHRITREFSPAFAELFAILGVYTAQRRREAPIVRKVRRVPSACFRKCPKRCQFRSITGSRVSNEVLYLLGSLPDHSVGLWRTAGARLLGDCVCALSDTPTAGPSFLCTSSRYFSAENFSTIKFWRYFSNF